MKRTNLVLDEQLLDEVTRVSGERTYSRAVTRAIEDYLRRYRAGRNPRVGGKRPLGRGPLRDERRCPRAPGASWFSLTPRSGSRSFGSRLILYAKSEAGGVGAIRLLIAALKRAAAALPPSPGAPVPAPPPSRSSPAGAAAPRFSRSPSSSATLLRTTGHSLRGEREPLNQQASDLAVWPRTPTDQAPFVGRRVRPPRTAAGAGSSRRERHRPVAGLQLLGRLAERRNEHPIGLPQGLPNRLPQSVAERGRRLR